MKISEFLTVFLSVVLSVACASTESINSPDPYFGNAKIKGSLSFPSGEGPFPAVVLMHGCSGLTSDVQKGLDLHSEFFTRNGFATLILDSFSSRGNSGGTVCLSDSNLAKARIYRQFDAINALLHLQSNSKIDPNNIFMMGQSNGGSVALALAGGNVSSMFNGNPNFRAIVAYYPWCGALQPRIEVPLLILSGEKDNWTPPDYCVNYKKRLKGATYEVIVYQDAHHGFDLPILLQTYAGHIVGGNSKATKDSRVRMLAWFQSYVE